MKASSGEARDLLLQPQQGSAQGQCTLGHWWFWDLEREDGFSFFQT